MKRYYQRFGRPLPKATLDELRHFRRSILREKPSLLNGQFIFSRMFRDLRESSLTHQQSHSERYKEQIKQLAKGKRVLIVGPRNLEALRDLADFGFEVHAVLGDKPSRYSAKDRSLFEQAGGNIYYGDVRRANLAKNYYDYVLMQDVLHYEGLRSTERAALAEMKESERKRYKGGVRQKGIINHVHNFLKPGGKLISLDYGPEHGIQYLNADEIKTNWCIKEVGEYSHLGPEPIPVRETPIAFMVLKKK